MRKGFDSFLTSDRIPTLEQGGVDDIIASPDLLPSLSTSARESIDSLQRQKMECIRNLHDLLRGIDREETVEWPEGKNSFHVWTESGNFFYLDEKGTRTILTEGEILTGGSWGIRYRLGPEIPRLLKKKYVVGETRRKIMGFLDRQIAVVESEQQTDSRAKQSFSAVLQRQRKSPDVLAWDDGHIAEQMVQDLFIVWERDLGLPITIVPVDLYDDVVNRLDFVVHVQKKQLGVEVDAKELGVGIQFTLMHRKDAVVGKRKTVKESLEKGLDREDLLQDILLVNMHPSYVRRALNAWKNRRLPGGPEGRLETAAKLDIFEKVFGALVDEQVLNQWRTKIFGKDTDKIRRLKTH